MRKIQEDNGILLNPHFRDLIDTPALFDEKDRLPGKDGEPGKGLKISEAVPLAETWWEKHRFEMPDYGKNSEHQVIKSGIMMGLPWMNLTKQEMLRVLAQWYAHVGVNMIIVGLGTSEDSGIKTNIADLKKEQSKVLPVLDKECTHATVKEGQEEETWGEEYDQIEKEDQLLDAHGNNLEMKGKVDEKS